MNQAKYEHLWIHSASIWRQMEPWWQAVLFTTESLLGKPKSFSNLQKSSMQSILLIHFVYDLIRFKRS